MNKNLKLCVLFIFALINSINANNLTIREGLSHNGVTSIMEDSRGYLWVSTYEGLNLYNGDKFRVYKNNSDTTMLLSNRLRSLCEDRNGNIWIGSDNGVMIFDYEHNRFNQITIKAGLYQNDNIIRSILQNSEGNIVALVESGGVAIFNESSELVSYHQSTETNLNDIIETSDGKYLITTDGGVMLYDNSISKFRTLNAILGRACEDISSIQGGGYAVATDRGVAILDSEYNEVKSVYSQYSIQALLATSNNELWIGTRRDGVIRIEDINDIPSTPNFVTTSRISCIYEGKSERVWVGSFDKGISLHTLRKSPIKDVDIYNGGEYRAFKLLKLDDENIVTRSDVTGYLKYNINTEEVSPILPKTLEDSKIFAIKSIDGLFGFFQNDTEIKQIYRFDSDERYTIYTLDGVNRLPDTMVVELAADSYGNIWCCYSNSVYRFRMGNESNKMIVERVKMPLINNNECKFRCAYIDVKNGSLWIASSTQGLYNISNLGAESISDLNIRHFTNQANDPESLSSNFPTSVERDNNGVLWVGTEQGGLLYVQEPEMLFFRDEVADNALQDRNIKSVLCDNDNCLWLASNKGLSKYDLESKVVRNYSGDNDVLSSNFTMTSTKFNESTLFFTASDRVIQIDTRQDFGDDETPQFYWGEFRLFNNVINPNDEVDGEVLFTSRLRSDDTIELRYDQNTLSIGVDILCFWSNKNNYVRYKLQPHNEEWIVNDDSNSTISLNGMNNGHYRLLVEVSSASGEWSETKALNIIIKPPFWKTWWAYSIYLLILLLIIYTIIRVLLKLQKLIYQTNIDNIERQNMAEKQRYFSNIAHEIKTPLALIVAPVNSLLTTFAHDGGVRERLQRVEIQYRKMTHLIDVAQSIQLSDAGLLNPQYSAFDFTDFMSRHLVDFVFLAGHDKKSIEVKSPDDIVAIKADISMVEKIVNNLLNNALKYTLSGDHIVVEWSKRGADLLFSVYDTGLGISEEDLPHIFERFYRGTNLSAQSPSGTGIGLSFSKRLIELHGGTITVESEHNKGTKFIITLPIITDEELTDTSHLNLEPDNNYIYDDMGALEDIATSALPESLVYIVEDNLEMRLMLKNIVGQFYNTECFTNGDEALKAMDNRWPDLILSDVIMPVIDGYDLCERVKSNIITSHIPVILLTACSSYDERIKGMEYGADLYLAKPFYPKYLITCIESILCSREKLRDRFKSGIPTRLSDEKQSTFDNQFLEKFHQLMVENITNEELNLDNFARELGVNRTHFYQKIKHLTGQTPFDLLKELRLSRAAELLVEEKMTVEEVCMNIGFKSRTHFSRLFKDKYGHSPKQFVIKMNK